MKFPFSLLKSFFPTTLTADEICSALTKIGLEVEHLSPFDHDILFDISLTPNLAHCNSVRGIARELAAFFDQKLVSPEF